MKSSELAVPISVEIHLIKAFPRIVFVRFGFGWKCLTWSRFLSICGDMFDGEYLYHDEKKVYIGRNIYA